MLYFVTVKEEILGKYHEFHVFSVDKSFLDITGFADVFSRFWRQKNPSRSRRFAKKSDPFRKPASGFSCPKGCEGRYCMQSIPLAVLKLDLPLCPRSQNSLHAIHTACGIETSHFLYFPNAPLHCMQSIPLAVLKKDRFVQNL